MLTGLDACEPAGWVEKSLASVETSDWSGRVHPGFLLVDFRCRQLCADSAVAASMMS